LLAAIAVFEKAHVFTCLLYNFSELLLKPVCFEPRAGPEILGARGEKKK
jgi:hypothetical protein